MSLYSKTVRLAHENQDMRPELLPLLQKHAAPLTLEEPTPEEFQEIRAIAKRIGKKYGAKISVRKGRGSIAGAVLLRNGDYPEPQIPEMRIELAEELIKRGFESVQVAMGGPNHSLRNHHIALARDWGHYTINMDLMKIA